MLHCVRSTSAVRLSRSPQNQRQSKWKQKNNTECNTFAFAQRSTVAVSSGSPVQHECLPTGTITSRKQHSKKKKKTNAKQCGRVECIRAWKKEYMKTKSMVARGSTCNLWWSALPSLPLCSVSVCENFPPAPNTGNSKKYYEWIFIIAKSYMHFIHSFRWGMLPVVVSLPIPIYRHFICLLCISVSSTGWPDAPVARCYSKCKMQARKQTKPNKNKTKQQQNMEYSLLFYISVNNFYVRRLIVVAGGRSRRCRRHHCQHHHRPTESCANDAFVQRRLLCVCVPLTAVRQT